VFTIDNNLGVFPIPNLQAGTPASLSLPHTAPTRASSTGSDSNSSRTSSNASSDYISVGYKPRPPSEPESDSKSDAGSGSDRTIRPNKKQQPESVQSRNNSQQSSQQDSQHSSQHSSQHGCVSEDSESSEDTGHDSYSIADSEYYRLPFGKAIMTDINAMIKSRAERGYNMDCAKNIEIFPIEPNELLRKVWIWLHRAAELADKNCMRAIHLDLSYLGVLGIWNSTSEPVPKVRINPTLGREVNLHDWGITCKEICRRMKLSEFKSCETAFPYQRRLCLAVLGCHFDPEDLEIECQRLEDLKEFGRAAGIAAFHGDLGRCVKALDAGDVETKLMASIVSAFWAMTEAGHMHTNKSSVWRARTARFGNLLEDPFKRSIFAYISNSGWKEVLDDISLPLSERIGIALRWMTDGELKGYLNYWADTAIKDADLEGIVLLGVTPGLVDLFQRYIDRTGDIQTAALVMGLTTPRYFTDDKVEGWISTYKELLKSWKLFISKCKFNVMRSQNSRNGAGKITAPIPKPQSFIRCTQCSERFNIGPGTKTCSKCGAAMPRCAICLTRIGDPISQTMKDIMEKELQGRAKENINLRAHMSMSHVMMPALDMKDKGKANDNNETLKASSGAWSFGPMEFALPKTRPPLPTPDEAAKKKRELQNHYDNW
jgi:hypothetical protein